MLVEPHGLEIISIETSLYNDHKQLFVSFFIFRKISQITQTVTASEEGEEICWRWLIAETVAWQRRVFITEWNKNTSNYQDEPIIYVIMTN